MNAFFNGPSGLGIVKKQDALFLDHQHTTNYPSQSVGVSTNTLANCYKSGSSQQTAASSFGNTIQSPNSYTTISTDLVSPITIGINYIIKL